MLEPMAACYCPMKYTTRLKQGLFYLQIITDYDTFLYIIRSLYKEVLRAGRRHESPRSLRRRIRRFERESYLPRCLSNLPLDDFLTELEEIQYIYPIYANKISFQQFHFNRSEA